MEIRTYSWENKGLQQQLIKKKKASKLTNIILFIVIKISVIIEEMCYIGNLV